VIREKKKHAVIQGTLRERETVDLPKGKKTAAIRSSRREKKEKKNIRRHWKVRPSRSALASSSFLKKGRKTGHFNDAAQGKKRRKKKNTRRNR